MKPPVFNPADWRPTTDGIWEIQAKPERLGDRPPYEAVCYLVRDEASGRPSWTYEVHRLTGSDPLADLKLVDGGPAKTLGHGQALAEAAAQKFRDQGELPDAQEGTSVSP